MLPDRVSNPGPLIYESGALPIASEKVMNETPVDILMHWSFVASATPGPRKFCDFTPAVTEIPEASCTCIQVRGF